MEATPIKERNEILQADTGVPIIIHSSWSSRWSGTDHT